jgi:hypothetical protein
MLLYLYPLFKGYMRRSKLIQIYRKLLGYFLLILFCGYFSSITFFPHTHIVDGVTIVHSHPFKSHSGNVPVNHNHSENGFLLIHFISHYIATVSIIFIGAAIIRSELNIRLLIQEETLILNLFLCSAHRPRAPTLQLHN